MRNSRQNYHQVLLSQFQKNPQDVWVQASYDNNVYFTRTQHQGLFLTVFSLITKSILVIFENRKNTEFRNHCLCPPFDSFLHFHPASYVCLFMFSNYLQICLCFYSQKIKLDQLLILYALFFIQHYVLRYLPLPLLQKYYI